MPVIDTDRVCVDCTFILECCEQGKCENEGYSLAPAAAAGNAPTAVVETSRMLNEMACAAEEIMERLAQARMNAMATASRGQTLNPTAELDNEVTRAVNVFRMMSDESRRMRKELGYPDAQVPAGQPVAPRTRFLDL